jgi:chromate transporter
MALWHMFLFFLQMGFVSFGGGYALIPMIEREALAQEWMSQVAFIDSVSVAGMAPGPIAINLGTIIGYQTFGIEGAVFAIAGLILPSLLMMALLMFVIQRLCKQAWMDSLFYGLQPIVTALIIYAVYRLGVGRLGSNPWDRHLLFGLGMIVICWMMLTKYRMHPIYILIFSAIGGVAFLS